MSGTADMERTQGVASRRLIEAILDTSPIGVALTDAENLRVSYANAALGQLLDMETALIPGEVLARRLPAGEEADGIQTRVRSGYGLGPISTRIRTAKGEHRWVALTIEPVATLEGMLVLWWVVDEEESHRLEQRLGASLVKEHDLLQRLEDLDIDSLTHSDPLTGAMVAERFMESGEALMITSRHTHEVLACLAVEVIDFETLRDTQGQGAADDVLKTVAQACRRSLRQIDLFGRLESDGRFAALLPNVHREQAERLRDSLTRILSAHSKRGLEGRFRFSARVEVVEVEPQDISFRSLIERTLEPIPIPGND